MSRRVKPKIAAAISGAGQATESSKAQAGRHAVEKSPAALVDLAEELGRLLARRLLADPGSRRGYSLPETLIGATIMAMMWFLIARTLSWFIR